MYKKRLIMKKIDINNETRTKLIDALANGDFKEAARLRSIQAGRTIVLKTFYDCLKHTSNATTHDAEVVTDFEPEFKTFFEKILN